jgi:hypothetical protein
MTVLPSSLREKSWQPGQSGNPSGKGGEYQRCRKLCREASASAAEEIIRLYQQSDDDRVRFMAAQWTFEQAWGKAPQYDPNADPEVRPKLDISRLAPQQQQQLRELLNIALAQTAVAGGESAKTNG